MFDAIQNRWLAYPHENCGLAVFDTGAYCSSMASNYNMRVTKPVIIETIKHTRMASFINLALFISTDLTTFILGPEVTTVRRYNRRAKK